MAISQNGYPANNRALVSTRTIPGTERKVAVRTGPAGDLLLWVAGQFDMRVEDIEAGQLDDWGYAERPIRGGTELSNHASGTAIDLNALKHPLGAVGTFSRDQEAVIHKILREAGGCIRWGGDYHGRRDEMHFEVVAGESACRRALAAARKTEAQEDTLSDKQVDEIVKRVNAHTDKRLTEANLTVRLDGKATTRSVRQVVAYTRSETRTVLRAVQKLAKAMNAESLAVEIAEELAKIDAEDDAAAKKGA